jgi:hypothetical protein
MLVAVMTPRIIRLKEQTLAHQPTSGLDRARLVTQAYQQTEGQPVILRRGEFWVGNSGDTHFNSAAHAVLRGPFGPGFERRSPRPSSASSRAMNARRSKHAQSVAW